MKKLNLEEFYQEGNAYYQPLRSKIPEGLGACILITPSQTVAVYNTEAKDINGDDIIGLGSHADTYYNIILNIFGQTNEEEQFRKARFINKNVLKYITLNYIVFRLVIDSSKYAIAEIPAYINEYQYAALQEVNLALKELNVERLCSITDYNPITGTSDPTAKRCYFEEENGLEEGLTFLKEQNRIQKNITIANALYEERKFNAYDEELTSKISL